jgi:hypothetical protein
MAAGEDLRPYVISEDVHILMSEWGKNSGVLTPSERFIADLTSDLCGQVEEATGCEVILVTAQEMQEGLHDLGLKTSLPKVILDRAYSRHDIPGLAGYFDGTRAVNEDLVKQPELVSRPGFEPLNVQYEKLKADVVSPIAVIDDVVFDGETLSKINATFTALNRPIHHVIAGVGVSHGIRRLEEEGIEVHCVRTFDRILDEVCERDFFAGVPLSGRTLIRNDGSIWSAPYFEPFGNPEDWASIQNESVRSFSGFCLSQSVELWRETEMASDKLMAANRVPRRIHSIDGSHSIVSALERQLTNYLTLEEEGV